VALGDAVQLELGLGETVGLAVGQGLTVAVPDGDNVDAGLGVAVLVGVGIEGS